MEAFPSVNKGQNEGAFPGTAAPFADQSTKSNLGILKVPWHPFMTMMDFIYVFVHSITSMMEMEYFIQAEVRFISNVSFPR